MLERWSPTLLEAYNTFILEASARRYTKRTLEHYRHRLGAFLRFLEAHQVTQLQQITPNHIRQYLIHLKDKGNASHTQHACARAIRAWLNFCVQEELLDSSPMRKVQMPKREMIVKTHLTTSEAQTILDACQTEREKTIFLFLLDTGLRATELCNLNVGNLDTQTGAVQVKCGKGQKDRVVYLGGKARRQLMRFWRKQGKPKDNQPLWVSEKGGGRLTGSGLRQIFVRLRKRTGIECHPHKLRRTFATWAWRGGMDLKSLQYLMGHADLDTLKAYLGISDEDLRMAHEKYGPVDNNLR